MTFSKILDFLRGLKIPIFNFTDTLFSQMIFVLFGVVVSLSMGGKVCHKTISKYTPEEFVNDIICNNRFYKQMLYKKVSIWGLH